MSSRRERKKRRTEVSSDSESSDSDEDVYNTANNTVDQQSSTEQPPKVVTGGPQPTIDGLNVPSAQLARVNSIFGDVHEMELDLLKSSSQAQLSSSQARVSETRNRLLDEYLGKMLGTYGEDLNELRGKPDFNGKTSLSLLAKMLKESGNVFDDDTLQSIVGKQ